MEARVKSIFLQECHGDTSFTGGWFLFPPRYSNREMREAWDNGIMRGIEIGLRRASLEGQRIELNENTPDGKNKEFLEKFYKLAEEYNCAIQYHPEIGMTVVDLGDDKLGEGVYVKLKAGE